jgi:enoyl-CoA hydratase/carnithine racemase
MGDVRVEQRGRVVLATLVNPPDGLMDAGIVDGLDSLVKRAESDPGVGAVVLTGDHAERFIAHYEVRELLEGARSGPSVSPRVARGSLRIAGVLRRVAAAERALARTPAAALVAIERFHEILLRMNRCGAVFIAALNGSAMGGGCELALACDMRIMVDGPYLIGQPEILLAFPPAGGGTQRLARLLGSGRALRLVLDGGPLEPPQAVEIGLVDELASPDTLIDRALAVADRLGRRSKVAIGACKRAVYEGGSLPLPDGLRVERAEFLAAFGTRSAEGAMQAYLDAHADTGQLPLYDSAARERALQSGRFDPRPEID